jgi:hypothetical protein
MDPRALGQLTLAFGGDDAGEFQVVDHGFGSR